MSSDPYGAPGSPAPAKSGGVGMVVMVILLVVLCGGGAVVGVGGVLMALLLPAVSAARDAAEEMKHQNDLKQLGLAYHFYVDEHDAAPQAWEDLGDYLEPLVRSELELQDITVRWGLKPRDIVSTSETVLAFPRNPTLSNEPTVSVLMMDGSVNKMAPADLQARLDAESAESAVP